MSRTFLITKTFDLFDAIDQAADQRVKQAINMRLASYVGGVAAFTALGLAAKMATTLKDLSGVEFVREALALMEEEGARTTAMLDLGVEYTSRAEKIRLMIALKAKFDDGVRAAGWTDYRGRSMEEELSRTTDPRQVRDADVSAIVEHFDGEVEAEHVKALLKQDATREASRNAERIDAAMIVIENALAGSDAPSDDNPDTALKETWLKAQARREALHFGDLDAQLRSRLLESARSALMQLEMDLLSGKSRGAGSAVEKLATLAVAKNLRKTLTEAVTALQQAEQKAAID
ncbi:hypothetical protein [Caldimonas sp. KR1-144]|uniref:hypothetical protein n=1 Tax=Caldimonas sp. KR1-144 TaxID=3400911 RepID=UPI003C037265